MFQPAPPPPDAPPAQLPAGHTVVAPMVGTFYAAASPKDPAFVQEGDEVRAGDSIGIIEAMKMMNEIETEVAGRVAKILVKNGQPVEYGQPLMVVEPL
jgi:acetyl-CoA carboxylase biotin carboxyl carrier protein